MKKSDVSETKPKRGRKSKKELLEANNKVNVKEITIQMEEVICSSPVFTLVPEIEIKNEENLIISNTNDEVKPGPKKRGRKPKGGKIVQQLVPVSENKESKPNVILHLKCSLKDLQKNNNEMFSQGIESFNFKNDLSYEMIENNPQYDNVAGSSKIINVDKTAYNKNVSFECDSDSEKEVETKLVWKKLKQLQHNLHINNISDKKSACFWCTYEFDNPPIYIPKFYIKDSYQVYGCFCSPECAVAHLMEENIDSSTKFERYHLLNHIYAKVYNYTKNIKPAPNAYYMLDKYYGNLSIQEYRSLLRNERFFLIVDKPLTRILPELHEDNEDHIINNKIIPSNNFSIKKKLQRKTPTKNNIVNEKFGMNVSQ